MDGFVPAGKAKTLFQIIGLVAKVEAELKKSQADNNLCLTNETAYQLWPVRN